MPFLPTSISGLQLFEPKIFGDERGYFFEAYNKATFAAAGIKTEFVQDNQARSPFGVLRGLHYQEGEYAQAKLVRVIAGSVFDVAVDLRPESPTRYQWYGTTLSEANQRQLFIPKGFAHGYLVTSKTAVFAYKCDNFYAPQAESGLRYNDPSLAISWPSLPEAYTIAARDLGWPLLKPAPTK
ncbi:MAG: dTDP-4-dehydrorhamnose 3,5-epimerase [Bacteroidota bacterium]